MPTITKKEVMQAVVNINDWIELDPPIESAEEMTIPEMKSAIEIRQKGEDKFEETDVLPGDASSLKINTVRQLRRLKVTLPEGWEKKYKDADQVFVQGLICIG